MFLFFASLSLSARYALLYAGSQWFFNYRHQADIYTIYNQLLNRGFTTANIAMYAYDDIATIQDNPYPGQVFHTLDHKTNVYPGSAAINVKGDDVNAEALFKGIRNLPTTNDDYVLVYYDNHGGPGTLGVPVGDQIYVDDLYLAFQDASKSKLYKKLLFIIEACYSGTIGKFLNVENMAIITAANEEESSYAATYDEELGTFLSDEFSNAFIALIDESPSISIGELFTTLQKQTTDSHVCYYGDESFKSLPISTFIGTPSKITYNNNMPSSMGLKANPADATEKTLAFLSQHPKAAIRAKARLQILKNKALTLKLETALDILVKYVDPKNYEFIMKDTKAKITPNYLHVLRVFSQKIGEINPDDYGRFNVIKALAEMHSKEEIIQGIYAVL